MSNVVVLHESRRLRRYWCRARKNRTNNCRGESWLLSRQRVITFNMKFVSMSKSHVASGWLSPPLTSRRPCVNATALQRPGRDSMQEVIEWIWEICHALECGGTQHVDSQCSCQDLVTRRHGISACNVVFFAALLVACTLFHCVRRSGTASLRGGRDVLSEYSLLGGVINFRNMDTSLVVFLRGIFSGLGPSEGGIVYGLFSKEALYIGKASVNRTHCPGLVARLTEHIPCLYRPGLKDASKLRYQLLRRSSRGDRFFPLAFFPQFLKHSSGSIGDIDGGPDGQCEGCGGGTLAAPQGRKCQGLGFSSMAVEEDRAKEATI